MIFPLLHLDDYSPATMDQQRPEPRVAEAIADRGTSPEPTALARSRALHVPAAQDIGPADVRQLSLDVAVTGVYSA